MGETSIRIDRRFCGPPTSANGGYTCGLVARAIEGAAEVTLRAPPPLDTHLALEASEEGTVLRGPDGSLVAEGRPISLDLELPEPVSFATAARASEGYVGFREHPYPGCFVCGPARPPDVGPGLRLFAGAVAGKRIVAAPWRPPADLCDGAGRARPELVWASLDCPSWFGHAAFVEHPPKILLGRLAAQIRRLPLAEEPCVVEGWAIGQEGRRILCGSALFDASGACLASARATWIEVKG